MDGARDFVRRTLIPRMDIEMAREPENPKSALQEKLQEEGITPTYKLVETQGPPHDRTFVSQVFAGLTALAQGIGRTKKESESQAAKAALDMIDADGAQAPDARTMKELQKAEAKRAQAKAKEEQRRAKEEAKRQRAEARKGKDASFFGWPLKPAEPRELPAAADDEASPADKEL